MLRHEPVKNGAFGVSHISGVVVVACLVIGWPCPAYSAEVETTAAPDEPPHLQLAPIDFSRSFGGSMVYVFQRNSNGSTAFVQQMLGVQVYADVRAQSFFWQPWLAQVATSLQGNVSGSNTKSGETPVRSSVNTGVNGDIVLSLLRYSRFPFQARAFRDDSRYTAFYSGTGSVNQHTGYSLSQNYMTQNRLLTSHAFFQSDKYGGPSTSPSYANSCSLSTTVQLNRNNSISISGDLTTQDQPAKSQSSTQDSLMFSHAYRPNGVFSVASLVNQYKYDLTKGSSPKQQVNGSVLQFNSFASVRPEKTPLTLTSSVRFFSSDINNNGTPGSALKYSNFNLGANYLFSPLIRIYGSVNISDSLGVQTVNTSAALTAAKAFAAATTIGDFRYSGSVGGSVSSNNKTTNSASQTITERSQSLGLYLSHALDKSSELGTGRLAKNLHQTITTTVGSNGTSISKLNSGGSLSWGRVEGKETTQLGLSAADSRYLNGPQGSFQMVNLQASRSEAVSRNESLAGSLTVQATHSGLQSNPNTITPSAAMSYNNQRAFKVLHLTFQSNLRISDTNIAPGAQNSLSPDQATRTWDNNFAYTVGRLELHLDTRLAKVVDTITSSIVFMMTRQF